MAGLSRLIACIAIAGLGMASQTRGRAAETPAFRSLQATRERPLFSPTRRPPPPSAADEPVAGTPEPMTAPPPSIKVSGIIVGSDRRIAIVTVGQTGSALHVSVGSDIAGWKVSAIEARRIELRHEARSMIVVLPEAGH